MRVVSRRAFFWYGCALGLLACQKTQEQVGAITPEDDTPPKELRIASAPYLAPDALQKAYARLTAYIEQETKVPTRFVIAKDYEDLIRLLQEDQAEIAIFPPFVYLEAKEKLPRLTALVSPIAAGAETSGSYLFTKGTSALKDVSDLKGKKVAFVDPKSTTGYFFPMLALLEAGLTPKRDLGQIVFLGSHDKVIQAVHEGTVDAGASYSNAINRYLEQNKLPQEYFYVLAKGPRSPHEVWAYAGSLSPGFVQRLRGVLFGISSQTETGRKVLAELPQINGFVETNEPDYEAVRKVAARVNAAVGEVSQSAPIAPTTSPQP